MLKTYPFGFMYYILLLSFVNSGSSMIFCFSYPYGKRSFLTALPISQMTNNQTTINGMAYIFSPVLPWLLFFPYAFDNFSVGTLISTYSSKDFFKSAFLQYGIGGFVFSETYTVYFRKLCLF